MSIPTLSFSLAEKSAIVKLMYSVILADGYVHPGEINAFKHFMYAFDFDSNFIQQANAISQEQGEMILLQMPTEKKRHFLQLLKDMAKSDGFVHKKEIALILNFCATIGIE